VRILKAEVEKGFMRTAFDHELVDPKAKINLEKIFKIFKNYFIYTGRKGIRLIFLNQKLELIKW